MKTPPAAFFAVWLASFAALQVAVGEPDISVRPIARDGQLLVSFEMRGGLTPEVRDAIQSGLPTTFSYDVELRHSGGWFERLLASTTVSATVRFDNLTRRYQMSRSVDGRVEGARASETFDEVGGWMTRFERVALWGTTALEANGEYAVRVRAHTRPRNASFLWPWGGTVLGHATFTFVQ
jgi:uncharacterized protein DUF4390